MLAPRTTTWSPILRIPHLRVGVVRRRELRRHDCPDARTPGRRATSGEPRILLVRPDGWFPVAGQRIPCSNAYAAAAVREPTPSLVRMLPTCRSTVFSLRNSSAAIARLLLPAATSASTWTSRALSPPGALVSVAKLPMGVGRADPAGL